MFIAFKGILENILREQGSKTNFWEQGNFGSGKKATGELLSLIKRFLEFVQTSSRYLFLLILYYHICKMLHSQLKLYNYLLICDFISNFPFNRGMKAMAVKGISFGQFVNKWQ